MTYYIDASGCCFPAKPYPPGKSNKVVWNSEEPEKLLARTLRQILLRDKELDGTKTP